MASQAVELLPWTGILYVIDILLVGALTTLLIDFAFEILGDVRKERARKEQEHWSKFLNGEQNETRPE